MFTDSSTTVCYSPDHQLFQGFVTAFDLRALLTTKRSFFFSPLCEKHNPNTPAGLSQQDSQRTRVVESLPPEEFLHPNPTSLLLP